MHGSVVNCSMQYYSNITTILPAVGVRCIIDVYYYNNPLMFLEGENNTNISEKDA